MRQDEWMEVVYAMRGGIELLKHLLEKLEDESATKAELDALDRIEQSLEIAKRSIKILEDPCK